MVDLLDKMEDCHLNGAEMLRVNEQLFAKLADLQDKERTSEEALNATKTDNLDLQDQVNRLTQELRRSER